MYQPKDIPRRTIVFSSLNLANLPIAVFISVLGGTVHYLHGKSIVKNQFLARLLRKTKIKPINLELAAHLCGNDPSNDSKLIGKVIDHFTETAVLEEFARYFVGVSHPERKLRTLIHKLVAHEWADAGLIRRWIESEHPECEILWLWYPSIFGRELAKPGNCKTVFLCPVLGVLVARLFRKMSLVLRRLITKITNSIHLCLKKNDPRDTPVLGSKGLDPKTIEVLFFPHKGVWFGRLFKKDYYYSSQVTSPFHHSKILHVRYYEESLRKGSLEQDADGYVYTTIDSGSSIKRLGRLLLTLPSWKLVWRSWRHVMLATYLARFYCNFLGYIDWLKHFPQARTALVGYDILMPLDIIMALEAKQIRSVAAQERFILTWYNGFSVNLDTYFCASEVVAETLASSQYNNINLLLPVGMQRTDWLYEKRVSNIISKRDTGQEIKKCIVALNYHSEPDYQENIIQPIINWRANRLFFEDMIRLAKELANIYIIIRGKDDVWCNMPYFSDVVDAIENAPNITINRDYDRQKVSYELCANTNLVIAKHTSLSDECLAIGIPVIFHEYTHNCQEGQTRLFSYLGLDNIVHDYSTLKRRTQELLSMSHEDYMKKYGEALKKIYGDYNDGHVCERIRAELEKIHSSSCANTFQSCQSSAPMKCT